MPPKISILLPVYNGENFLARQLESILAQSFGDFELLIQDDASRDTSWAIISKFAHADPRISATRGTANQGQGATLRQLFKLSRAELLSFSDQDDVWHECKLERLLAALSSASAAYGPSHLIDADGNDLDQTIFDHVGPPAKGKDDIGLLTGNSVSGHAMLVRRTTIGPNAFGGEPLYDWRIAVAATFANGIAYVDDAITYHRVHQSNQVNRMAKDAGKQPQRKRAQRMRELIGLLDHVATSECVEAVRRTEFANMRDLLLRTESRRAVWRRREVGAQALVVERLAALARPDDHSLARFHKKLANMMRPVLDPARMWHDYVLR